MPKKKAKLPLSKTHPKLAKEADGWDPSSVTAGSGKKMTWRCRKNHKWEAAVYSRTSKNLTGCPFCSGQKVLKGWNDLKTTHPAIAKEAYGWDPSKLSKGSEKKLKWKCSKKHIYQSSVSNRTGSGKSGCSICAGKKVLAGFNDLATTHPELAKQALGWDPKTVLSGSDIKRNWICKQRHRWTVSPNSRTSKQITGCPICSNHKLEFGTNDLLTFDKKIASEAFGWDPRQVTKFSSKKVEWTCSKGHLWEARVYSRTRNRTGCPVCRNLKILVGTNDLATTHPTLAKQAYGWDPTKIVSGTKKRLAWKCEVGHTWSSNVELRTKQKTGCPFCTNQKTLSGFNDLATTHPKLALEALGWDPEKFTAGSAQRVKWKCSFNHIWVSSVRSRGFKNTGCPTCMGRITLKGFNDLATKYPAIAREAFGWDPTKISPGSRLKKKWKCEYGHTWTALVSNRAHLARGCPSCSKTGFDPNKTGWLYLLEHDDWGMLQIGISNVPEMRVKEHSSLGWELLDIRGPMDGLSAQNLETNLLASLFKKEADLSNSKIAGKFDGYSEAWSKSTFPVKSIKELMQLTEEFEEN